MLVYLNKNYDVPDLFRQTPGNQMRWGDLEFTTECPEACDYVVVFNHPVQDIHTRCRRGGKILIIQEPPYHRNDYLKNYFSYFDHIIAGYEDKRVVHAPAALPWLVDKGFDELIYIEAGEKKADKLSWVTSNFNVNPGHQPRLDFLEKLKNTDLKPELYGRGIRSLENKWDGLFPYKYCLAIENYVAKDYWTEKITDPFLAWTLPIYYGCLNLEDYFPHESFVRIDIQKPEEAFEIIRKAMKDKLWEKNLSAIKEARNLVLHTYNFFPFIASFIEKLSLEDDKKKCFIPFDPKEKKTWTGKLKRFFN